MEIIFSVGCIIAQKKGIEAHGKCDLRWYTATSCKGGLKRCEELKRRSHHGSWKNAIGKKNEDEKKVGKK